MSATIMTHLPGGKGLLSRPRIQRGALCASPEDLKGLATRQVVHEYRSLLPLSSPRNLKLKTPLSHLHARRQVLVFRYVCEEGPRPAAIHVVFLDVAEFFKGVVRV